MSGRCEGKKGVGKGSLKGIEVTAVSVSLSNHVPFEMVLRIPSGDVM